MENTEEQVAMRWRIVETGKEGCVGPLSRSAAEAWIAGDKDEDIRYRIVAADGTEEPWQPAM
jgi:hypothetical protein